MFTFNTKMIKVNLICIFYWFWFIIFFNQLSSINISNWYFNFALSILSSDIIILFIFIIVFINVHLNSPRTVEKCNNSSFHISRFIFVIFFIFIKFFFFIKRNIKILQFCISSQQIEWFTKIIFIFTMRWTWKFQMF